MPACDDRIAAMVARLEPLAVNGHFEDSDVADAAVADQRAPQTVWLVSRGIESTPSRLDRDLNVALAKRALPFAYHALSNDRVAEARRIIRALSVHGPRSC